MARRCQPEAVAFLLNNGANPNAVLDESGTVRDWIGDYTQFLFEYKPEDEAGEQVRQRNIARLSSIFKLVVQAGASTRERTYRTVNSETKMLQTAQSLHSMRSPLRSALT